MNDVHEQPSEQAKREAKLHPNGWVYQIVGAYGPGEPVPPEAIAGAWKVDGNGNIIGEFIPNSNYRPRTGDSLSAQKPRGAKRD